MVENLFVGFHKYAGEFKNSYLQLTATISNASWFSRVFCLCYVKQNIASANFVALKFNQGKKPAFKILFVVAIERNLCP